MQASSGLWLFLPACGILWLPVAVDNCFCYLMNQWNPLFNQCHYIFEPNMLYYVKICTIIGGLAALQTPLLSREASPTRSPILTFYEYELCKTCYLEVYTTFRHKIIKSTCRPYFGIISTNGRKKNAQSNATLRIVRIPSN